MNWKQSHIKGNFSILFIVSNFILIILFLPITCLMVFLFIKTISVKQVQILDLLYSILCLMFGVFFIILYEYIFKRIEIKNNMFIIKPILRNNIIVDINEIEYYEGFIDTKYGKTKQLIIVHEGKAITRVGHRELTNYNEFLEFFKSNNKFNEDFQNEPIPKLFKIYFLMSFSLLALIFVVKYILKIN